MFKKVSQFFSRDLNIKLLNKLSQSQLSLAALVLIQVLAFTAPIILSISKGYESAVLNSVDGPTHQMFGELYTEKLKSDGLSSLLSNRFSEVSFGARFPDKYPPLFHILCSGLSIAFNMPWAYACLLIVFCCFIFLMYELSQWLKLMDGSYSERKHLHWIFWLTMSAILFSDYSMPEKGLSFFAVIIVGLYAQLLFSCLFLSFVRHIAFFNTRSIDIFKSTLLLILCFWSNILSFPLCLIVLFYLIFTYRLQKPKVYIPFVLATVCVLPWLLPFTELTLFSPSKMKTMALRHYTESTLIYFYSFILLSILFLKKLRYLAFWALALLFVSQCAFWSLSHDFFRDHAAFNLLTNLPVQFSRYWPYFIVACMLAMIKELKHKDLPQCIKKMSPLTLGLIMLLFNTLIFESNYNTLFVDQQYHWENKKMLSDIKAFQKNNPRYINKHLMVPTLNDTWLARTVASDLKTQAVRSKIFIDYNGYHESSVIMQLIEPARNQLVQEKPGGLFYIPKYHNDLLFKSVGIDGMVQILNEFNIGMITCPRNSQKGLCRTLTDKQAPSFNLISQNFWWTAYAVPQAHQELRKPILVISDLGAKVRNSLSQMRYVTFYENVLFSNKVSEYKIFYLHPKFSKEALICALEFIHKEKGLTLVQEDYEKSIKTIASRLTTKTNIYYESESQTALQKVNQDKNLKANWYSSTLPSIFDESMLNVDNKQLTLIQAPFFKKKINCN